MAPTVGRIVHYRISAQDAEAVNRRRSADPAAAGWPKGAQAHFGNTVVLGDIVPMIVTHVWADEFGPGMCGVNGQALLDGNDSLWVTSAPEGAEAGTWCWPPRQE